MDNIAKKADAWLSRWADEIRSGNRIDLGYKISSVYSPRTPGGTDHAYDLADTVDHIVGAMQEPLRRVVRRYYLDEIPGKRFLVYKKGFRTTAQKAKTESMSERAFKDYLRIGRHVVYYAMDKSGFNPE